MILENEGVRLRALEPEDLELLYIWENEEANWRQSNTLVPYSKFILKNYIANSHKTLFETCQLRFMIDNISTGKTIGMIDLFEFDHYHHRAGIGILIADVNERQKGYASAALGCIIRYAFETLYLHQLWCNILTGNNESLKLFQRHGFQVCATKHEWVLSGRDYADELMLQLINNG